LNAAPEQKEGGKSMIAKEALEGMTAEQVMQLLQEVKARHSAAIAQANAAINGYEKAVNVRDAKIKELKDDLSRQLADIADKAEALTKAMLKASLTGDGAALDKVQGALTELEGQRSQLNARLDLLSGKPPRCDEVYAAMETAVSESKGADTQYAGDVAVIREFCEETVKPWSEIISAIGSTREGVSRFFLDRARGHYSSEN